MTTPLEESEETPSVCLTAGNVWFERYAGNAIWHLRVDQMGEWLEMSREDWELLKVFVESNWPRDHPGGR